MSLLPRLFSNALSASIVLGFIFAIPSAVCSETPQPQEPDYYILTPKPSPKPKINGAKTFGVRPGNPLLYTIAATGKRPMEFSATNLPKGLTLDTQTGQITGTVDQRSTYHVMLQAKNSLGCAKRELRIVVGDKICLTPLLGCNTFGGWGAKVTDQNLRDAAKAMVDSGLLNHGWQYINIDDGWQGQRGSNNAIMPNKKFPDMKALCDYIHSLGLKAGIYSTPWSTSYAGFIGGSSHTPDGAWKKLPQHNKDWKFGKHFFEEADVRQWAEWGFDYCKYDWALDHKHLTKENIAAAKRLVDQLNGCGRDMVLELSNSIPLEQAAEYAKLGQVNRTTGDLIDLWDRSQMGPEKKWAVGIREVWLQNDPYAPHQTPGHWNHACNLRIGLLGGWRGRGLTPSRLTPDEQYVHMSLWCLWSSPMIIGTPIEKLDEFTLSLLSNDEVLELNQDPLGDQGRRIDLPGDGEAVCKKMEDGTKAVGLFNVGPKPTTVSVPWSAIGLKGPQRVRDLWRQKDLGVFEDHFQAKVPAHGVVLVRFFQP